MPAVRWSSKLEDQNLFQRNNNSRRTKYFVHTFILDINREGIQKTNDEENTAADVNKL